MALLCSRKAPGLSELLAGGTSWRLVSVVTSDPQCQELSRLHAVGVPTLIHDIRAFYAARNARLGDLQHRPDYDRQTAELLAPFRPDLVVCCGYLHILTEPLLTAYPQRVINVHDSDLPKYQGLRATRDAVLAGERETRSTVHLVTAGVDVGPPLVRSWPFPVLPFVIDVKGYAYAHRDWMMTTAWGPLLVRAIERFARDEVRFLGGRAVVAGALGPEELASPTAAAWGGRRVSGGE